MRRDLALTLLATLLLGACGVAGPSGDPADDGPKSCIKHEQCGDLELCSGDSGAGQCKDFSGFPHCDTDRDCRTGDCTNGVCIDYVGRFGGGCQCPGSECEDGVCLVDCSQAPTCGADTTCLPTCYAPGV